MALRTNINLFYFVHYDYCMKTSGFDASQIKLNTPKNGQIIYNNNKIYFFSITMYVLIMTDYAILVQTFTH